jgi:hypothetical protein
MENYQTNVSLHHIFREENQYADFFAKLKAPLDADFLYRVSPPKNVRGLFRNNITEIFFFHK